MQVILIYYNIYIFTYDFLKDKDSTSIIYYYFYFILFIFIYIICQCNALGTISFTRIMPMLGFTVTWAIIPVKPMTLGFYLTLVKTNILLGVGACAVTNSL